MPKDAQDETFRYKGYKVEILVMGCDRFSYKILSPNNLKIAQGERRGKMITKNHCKAVINERVNAK